MTLYDLWPAWVVDTLLFISKLIPIIGYLAIATIVVLVIIYLVKEIKKK